MEAGAQSTGSIAWRTERVSCNKGSTTLGVVESAFLIGVEACVSRRVRGEARRGETRREETGRATSKASGPGQTNVERRWGADNGRITAGLRLRIEGKASKKEGRDSENRAKGA